MNRRLALAACSALWMLSFPAMAQENPGTPVRVRGIIEKVEEGMLTVRSRENETVKLATNEKTGYASIKGLQFADIKPNSYVGVAGRPLAGGGIEAIEVLVFPEAARGTGEGHRDWDLLPNSSMTNATVTAAVSSTAARSIDVAYHGKQQTIRVPEHVPVVTFLPATGKDAAPGLTVFISALKDATGKLTASRVVMEKDGVKPPM
ncbi:hypothetical protein SAMN06265795_10384 [Noviherbaspirillum humi]|uniref:Uncharacterized protein n=1 Tax=Noviherbaspirillum humi TaxID=1688639 RepID=A0A239F0N7_9BURK|nr:hypothetical protein [Noviherbaspirillum humi]SNS49722.1 hypothetical protein SAMN06265795_10384 [Noviherbaspirillum humi]